MPYAKEQRWVCNVCKGEIIVDKDGEGDLVCCGQKMELAVKEEPETEEEPPKPGEIKEEPEEPPKPSQTS